MKLDSISALSEHIFRISMEALSDHQSEQL